MKLLEYLEARVSKDVAMQHEVEAYEKEQDKRFSRLEEENESLREALDIVLTDIVPSLEG